MKKLLADTASADLVADAARHPPESRFLHDLRIQILAIALVPLLVTIYFPMIRENQIFGTAFGMSVGLLEDALSHGYLGQMGMAKALVGYLAATAGLKLEFDNLLVRGFLIGAMVSLHDTFIYLLTHQLLGLPEPFEPLHILTSTMVNVALGLMLFPLFDRIKKRA